MSDLITAGLHALSTVALLDNAEAEMLKFPQADCPVVHHFGPGVCIREVFMPAGTLAIGHKQKYDHLNLLLRGKVMVVRDDGVADILSAPLLFVGKPGRKIGYVLEDMVWQNIYATDFRNADDVEAHFVEKSDDWLADHKVKFAIEQTARAADHADYFKLISDFGLIHEDVQKQVQNKDDQVWIDSPSIRVSDSPIDGKGLFVTCPVKAGEVICAARVNGKRTQAGRFTNHSVNPNAEMRLRSNGDIDLVALVDFAGCKGGEIGTEATINYRNALALSGVMQVGQEYLCQQ